MAFSRILVGNVPAHHRRMLAETLCERGVDLVYKRAVYRRSEAMVVPLAVQEMCIRDSSYGGRLYRAEVPSPGGTPDASADYSLLSVLGPTGATGPTGPAGSLPNDALYLQSTASTAPIADGAALWANTPVINRTTSIGLSYTPAKGAITVQDAGRYLLLWPVSAQPSGAGQNRISPFSGQSA